MRVLAFIAWLVFELPVNHSSGVSRDFASVSEKLEGVEKLIESARNSENSTVKRIATLLHVTSMIRKFIRVKEREEQPTDVEPYGECDCGVNQGCDKAPLLDTVGGFDNMGEVVGETTIPNCLLADFDVDSNRYELNKYLVGLSSAELVKLEKRVRLLRGEAYGQKLLERHVISNRVFDKDRLLLERLDIAKKDLEILRIKAAVEFETLALYTGVIQEIKSEVWRLDEKYTKLWTVLNDGCEGEEFLNYVMHLFGDSEPSTKYKFGSFQVLRELNATPQEILQEVSNKILKPRKELLDQGASALNKLAVKARVSKEQHEVAGHRYIALVEEYGHFYQKNYSRAPPKFASK